MEWFRRLFLIILNISARQDKELPHDEVSFKMEEKHGDHWNLSSSQGHKYFTMEIPQGFLPQLHFFFGVSTLRLYWFDGSRMPHYHHYPPTKKKITVSFDVWVSIKPRWMLGLNSILSKIGTLYEDRHTIICAEIFCSCLINFQKCVKSRCWPCPPQASTRVNRKIP